MLPMCYQAGVPVPARSGESCEGTWCEVWGGAGVK